MSVNVKIYNMGTKENPVTESEMVDKLTTLIKEISAVNLNLSDLNITITKKSNRVQIADINLSSYEIKYIDKDTVSRKLSYYNEDIEKSVIIEFEESTTE